MIIYKKFMKKVVNNMNSLGGVVVVSAWVCEVVGLISGQVTLKTFKMVMMAFPHWDRIMTDLLSSE